MPAAISALVRAAALAAFAPVAPFAGQADAPARPWTLLVYGAADNNADGPILEFLDRVRKALDDDPGMELVLFLDRSEGFSDDASLLGEDFTGARVYRLRKDSAELLDASEHFPEMVAGEEWEADSAHPENVARFIRFGKQRFPAQRYGLLIYSHADGCTMCPDEQSGRDMRIPELTDWVEEGESVDFMALELCNMGGVEIAYQWRPGNGGFAADVLVAIPNAGPPLDWDRAFARIRTPGHAPAEDATPDAPALDPARMTAVDFGELVIEEGYLGRKALAARHPQESQRIAHEAAACYDLDAAEDVKVKVDRLAVALARTDAKEAFEGLRGPGDAATVMNYVHGRLGDRPYVDLYDLLDRAARCKELAQDVRAAAEEAKRAVDRLVVASFGMDGYTAFEPGRSGIFIVFPDGDAGDGSAHGGRAWARLSWYTPLEASDGVGPYGRWAFLRDGATPENGEVENWFELLDCWFDDASQGPGGFNRYAW